MRATILLASFLLFALVDKSTSSFLRFKLLSERLRESYGSEPLPSDQWIEQRLDHFSIADTRTWNQRYYVNDEFFKPGGPVFLNIGGEGEESPKWMVSGSWIDDAKKYGALLFSVEHRYYGQSRPTKDMSTENLAYLSSDQALEDLAYFISQMKIQMDIPDNKWVVFGGSYSGSLAAWFRLKYPHLAVGAVASSAPIYAQLHFPEYLRVSAASLATTGPECNANIEKATKDLEKLTRTWNGRRKVTEKFRLCDKLNGWRTLDEQMFYQAIAESFNFVVQYNKDNRNFNVTEQEDSGDLTIDTICDIMNNEDMEPVDRFAGVTNALLEQSGQDCFPHTYRSFIKTYGATDWESEASAGGRQWFYQTCTEFGWFQSSEDPDQPFGNHYPLDLMLQQCVDLFGKKFTREFIEAGVASTNSQYGGYDIKGSNIIFPNGSIDPWHYLSPLADVSETETAVYINGTAHCANMYPPTESDPPELVEARERISEAIGTWIQ